MSGRPRYYLGLAASFHDPAMALVSPEGEVLFAEATERYLQDKRAFNAVPDHLLRTPELLARHCDPDAELVLALTWSRRVLDDLRLAQLGELPLVRKLARPLSGHLARIHDHQVWPYPDLMSLRDAMLASLTLASLNVRSHRATPKDGEIRRLDHHLTHAANACFTSPFREAVCLVVDGYGEWTSLGAYHYSEGRLRSLLPRRHGLAPEHASLGMFYAALCGLCGFDPLKGEEWKVMGLAPYGRVDPELVELLRPMVRAKGMALESAYDGSRYGRVLGELQARFARNGRPALEAADLARSGQEVFSEVMLELLGSLHALGLSENLVLGGGCALNSSFNGRIVVESPFRTLHVPSAPADDGNALGAALLAFAADRPDWRPPSEELASPYLGSEISTEAVERVVGFGGFRRVRRAPETLTRDVAALLAEGKVVGWVQGRAEFGPRALGNRSILADPRDPGMKDRLNDRVKFREEFRPFAPSILHEHGDAYFEHYQASPYMERALRFREEVRDRVPAVVHVDGTGRLQTVERAWAPRYHGLLSDFHALTGVPVLLNTSFNVMGKPIIHSVEDALGVFATSGLDALVLGDHVIEKEAPS